MYEMQGPHWPGVPVSYRLLGCLRYAGPHHLFGIPRNSRLPGSRTTLGVAPEVVRCLSDE